MFNWFNRSSRPYPQAVEQIDNKTTTPAWASLSKEIPPMPDIAAAAVTPNDYYRVGYDNTQGATTLTLHTGAGNSMTLSLCESEVMRLIRLLDATLDYDIRFADDEDNDND